MRLETPPEARRQAIRDWYAAELDAAMRAVLQRANQSWDPIPYDELAMVVPPSRWNKRLRCYEIA